MSLIRKRDVKTHFSSRHRKGPQLVQQADKPAIAALLVADLAIEEQVPAFVDDFSLEHSSPGGAVSAVVIVSTLGDSQVPEEPNILQP